MNKLVSFLKKGDRAVLNYMKDGSSRQAIVQIISSKNINNGVWFVVRAPLHVLEQINGVALLDQNKYEIEEDWGVTLVSSDALSPLQKPLLRLV